MKKSLKILLLLVLSLIIAASAMLLVACNNEEDPNEFVNGQGNTVRVILDSLSDPLIKDSVDKITNGYLDYRLKPNTPVPEPGKTKDTKAPMVEGYLFVGYYEGTVDENGVLTFGNKWNFATKVSSDMTLYGKWVVQYKIRINFVLNGQVVEDKFEEINVADNAATVNAIKEPSWTGNTYIQMYTTAACAEGDELVVSSTQPFAHGCDDDHPTRDVYAKFIEGRWTLVHNVNDIRSISAGASLYLLADLDMSELGTDADGYTKWSVPVDFTGKIDGNGHTISNFNFKRIGTNSAKNPATNNYLGLFSRLNNATICNVTFKDCTVTGVVQYQQTSDDYYYGFIAGQAMGDCTFDNITFDNCTLAELEFNIRNVTTPEQIAAERAKITQGKFVGYGSDFTPNII